MSPPSTAREALLAEALGDLASLIDRVEALVPVVTTGTLELQRAGESLTRQLTAFERRMGLLTEQAKAVTVQHIVQRTEEAAQRSVQAQLAAVNAAVEQAVSAALATLLLRQQRPAFAWRWVEHLLTAAMASGATWLVVATKVVP